MTFERRLDVSRLLVQRPVLTLAASALATVGATVLLGPAYGGAAATLGIVLTSLLGLGMFLGSRRKRSKLVRADAAGVSLDGQLALPAEQLLGGYVTRGAVPQAKLVHTSGNECMTLDVPTPAVGEELLAALGLDPKHRALEVSGASLLTVTVLHNFLVPVLMFALVVLGMLITRPLVPQVGPILAVLAGVAGGHAFFWSRSRITVGNEGVNYRWLGFDRYVAYADMASVSSEANRIVITLDSGEKVRLPIAVATTVTAPVTDQKRIAIEQRIREQLDRYRARTAQAPPHELVAREGRSTRDWLGALTDLTRGDTTYREPVVPAEDLCRVLDDPSSDPSARVGAAVALKQSGDQDHVRRVRVAAAMTAQPKLRVALERVAEASDDDALLDPLDASATLEAARKRA
jgi:hypothetical protein